MFPGRICGIQVRPNRIKCVFCFFRELGRENFKRTKKKKKLDPDLLLLTLPHQLRSSSLFPSLSLSTTTKNKKRQNSRDYAIACANEASMALAARRGKKVPTMGYRKPRATDDSFHKMWFSHLQWKAWRLDRQGGGYIPRY